MPRKLTRTYADFARDRKLFSKQTKIKKLRGEDLTGKSFGKLFVVAELLHKDVNGTHRRWLCLCIGCGDHVVVLSANLKSKLHPKRSCVKCNDKRHNMKRPYESSYNRLVWSAAKQSHSLKLTYEEFLEFTKTLECHYCGEQLVWNKHLGSIQGSRGYNLDRKDNSLGYSKENCVVCCVFCNFTKGDRFTYEQFVQIGKVIRSFRCS
jgi:hypothetical protein